MGSSCSLNSDTTVASLPPMSDDFDFNSADSSDAGSDADLNGVVPGGHRPTRAAAGGSRRRKKTSTPTFQPPPYISLRAFHDDRFPEEDPAMRVYYNHEQQQAHQQQQQAAADERRRQQQLEKQIPQACHSGDFQPPATSLDHKRINSNNPLDQSSRTNNASALSDDGGSPGGASMRHRHQTVVTPAMLTSFNRGDDDACK